MSAIKTESMLMIGGAVVVGLLAMKFLPAALKGAGGLVSGNNSLTQNQHNADGTPQTAYVGAGIPGTLGAAANTASGGIFSSVGDWLGSKTFDLFNPSAGVAAPINPAPDSTAAATDKYTQGGNASSGSGSLDMFSDPEGWGAQWGQ